MMTPSALTASELRVVLADALQGAAERVRARHQESQLPQPQPAFEASETVIDTSTSRLALSIPEAAESLGVGRSSIYHEIRSGQLPVLRFGRRTLIPVPALTQWVKERTKPYDA